MGAFGQWAKIMKKIALITGAGKKRLGWHVAKRMGLNGYGIVLHYRSDPIQAEAAAKALEALGVQVSLHQANLANESEVEALFQKMDRDHGGPDLLVNCASIWVRKRLESTSAQDLMQNFEANVLATFLCAKNAGLRMTARPTGGHIVNIGDWATKRPYLDYSAYFASKGAISTLTRCLAVELGVRNPKVRVNCIQPGPVMLPEGLPVKERNEAIQGTLVQREGSPEDVARAVQYLDENEFLTGVDLPVDGGRSVWARGS